MTDKFKFCNISGDVNTSLDDFILVENGDYHKSYITKKTFEHREPELNFNYKYVVHASYFEKYAAEELFDYQITDEEKENWEWPAIVEVYMVLTPEYIEEKIITDTVMTTYGWEETWKDDLNDDQVMYFIIEYGLGIPLVYDRNELIPGTKVDNKIFAGMQVVDCIDRLRGFFLDKPMNHISTTGWDRIRYLIGDIDNDFRFSMNRLRKQLDKQSA